MTDIHVALFRLHKFRSESSYLESQFQNLAFNLHLLCESTLIKTFSAVARTIPVGFIHIKSVCVALISSISHYQTYVKTVV